MFFRRLRMGCARWRTKPRPAYLMAMPSVIGGGSVILPPRPTQLPVPLFFFEVVTQEVLLRAIHQYVTRIEAEEVNLAYQNGSFSLQYFLKHLEEAALQEWIRAVGADSKIDGQEVGNIHYQRRWVNAMEGILARKAKDQQAIRDFYKNNRIDMALLIQGSRSARAIQDYLRKVIACFATKIPDALRALALEILALRHRPREPDEEMEVLRRISQLEKNLSSQVSDSNVFIWRIELEREGGVSLVECWREIFVDLATRIRE